VTKWHVTTNDGHGPKSVRIEIAPPSAWLVLDCADRGNPVDDQFVTDITEAWALLAENPEVSSIGVRSIGPSFSVGILPGTGRPSSSIGPKSCGNWRPVVIELGGDIAAGAFELLGQADAIISAPDVLLTVPADPISRLDVQYLRPRLPEAELRRLALMGAIESMTANRAVELGVIDVLVPRHQLHRRAENAVSMLADHG
jgi:enoyl-CoA hydratase/carnithine racemase